MGQDSVQSDSAGPFLNLNEYMRGSGTRTGRWWSLIERNGVHASAWLRTWGTLPEEVRLGFRQAAEGSSGVHEQCPFEEFEEVEPEWVEIDSARVRVEGTREFGVFWLGKKLLEQFSQTPAQEHSDLGTPTISDRGCLTLC